jgi:BirA family biotin operon repressor/biotin-[acetyl-CoA-carboxylase] ligase
VTLPSAAAQPQLAWDAPALQQALQTQLPGLVVEAVAEIGSTNTALLERQRAGLDAPTLLVAEQQSAGRGRLGRSWWSEPGSTLTFSLGLALAPADWSGLSLAVGLAVAEALDGAAAGERIGLKWPNDLWLRGEDRKLAGILIEAQALRGGAHGGARWTVIGVGINIRPPQGAAGDFRSGYACLTELDDGLSAPAALQRVAPALLAAVQRFQQQGLAPLLPAYAGRDVLAGRRVSAGERRGTVLGIAPGGELRLRDDAGQVHLIASGEVSVRPC